MTQIKMNLQKLSKNAPKVNLSKVSAKPLKTLLVSVEWNGGDYDLDLNAFGCRGSEIEGDVDEFVFTHDELKAIENGDVCTSFTNWLMYNNKHTRFGVLPKDVKGGGDEAEQMFIQCDQWQQNAQDITKINLWMDIFNEIDDIPKDTFGEVKGATVKLINKDTGEVLQAYDVGAANPNANSMYIGYLTINNGEISFKPAGTDGTPLEGKINSMVDVLGFYFQ